jgi:hypothetical protein
MAEHRFVYTVSGVTLSNAQQAKISEAIGIAVAQVLTGDAAGTVRTDFLNINRIYGGRWIEVAEAEKIGVDKILTDKAGGAGPSAP